MLASTVWRNVPSKHQNNISNIEIMYLALSSVEQYFFKDTGWQCYNSNHSLQEFLAMLVFSENKQSLSVIIGIQECNFSKIHRNKSNGSCTIKAQTSKIKEMSC